MSASNVQQDLQVEPVSSSLQGLRLDVVVSGSIGAVESVRFIRALRRLGANVTPWLTSGGAQFITPTSLSWAAANQTRENFAGETTHIATGDACIIAPASANFIGSIAQGMMGSAATALVHSYLGQRLPVLFLPTMHNSLKDSPPIAENLAVIERWATVLQPRVEEGKQKFPDPAALADECSHHINLFYQSRRSDHMRSDQSSRDSLSPHVLVTMGTTRGYLDDVRYLSNYSSGALGTLLATELYRRGIKTHVVSGPAMLKPAVYSQLIQVETNTEMLAAAKVAIANGVTAGVFAASVLDYVPAQRHPGKVRSGEVNLNISLKPTEKIIEQICENSKLYAKVGFKLESDFSESEAKGLAEQYAKRYGLTMVAVNRLSDVDAVRHSAITYVRADSIKPLESAVHIATKAGLASSVADHVVKILAQIP